MKKATWISIGSLVGALTFYLIYRILLPSLPEDNVIEETVEGIIERETGWDVDLTPSSQEPAGDGA